MGIYLFRTEVLYEVLTAKPLATDFGKEVFPRNYKTKHVCAHLFDGYWEDLGTIKSYHEASLALAAPNPPFDFFSPEGVIYTRMRNLPPSRINGAVLEHSVVADGCVIGCGSRIERSLIGVRSVIGSECVIRDVVMIGSDNYETAAQKRENARARPAGPERRRRDGDRAGDPRQGVPDRPRGEAREPRQPAGRGWPERPVPHPRRHHLYPARGHHPGWNGDLRSKVAKVANF